MHNSTAVITTLTHFFVIANANLVYTDDATTPIISAP